MVRTYGRKTKSSLRKCLKLVDLLKSLPLWFKNFSETSPKYDLYFGTSMISTCYNGSFITSKPIYSVQTSNKTMTNIANISCRVSGTRCLTVNFSTSTRTGPIQFRLLACKAETVPRIANVSCTDFTCKFMPTLRT